MKESTKESMEEKLIYVVDDEKDIREMEKTFLENEGFRVETFAGADQVMGKLRLTEGEKTVNDTIEGNDAYEGKKPDLILMDIMMPGTDGLSACSRIRKSEDPLLRALPIILVSAKDTPIDRVTGLTMGSDDYLIKPFLPLELVARVKALLRRSDILRNQMLISAENSALTGEDEGKNGKISGTELNGGKSAPDVGKKTEKCGNLVVDFAAHRVYVESVMENDEYTEPEKTEYVDKEPDITEADACSGDRNICEKKQEENPYNSEKIFICEAGTEYNGIKMRSVIPKNESLKEEKEKNKGEKITEIQVTPMEFDFVHFLILRKETAVSKSELLSVVWKLPDAELHEDVRMTDDLVKRLRKKLRAAGSSARVETVWGFGYRMTEN